MRNQPQKLKIEALLLLLMVMTDIEIKFIIVKSKYS